MDSPYLGLDEYVDVNVKPLSDQGVQLFKVMSMVSMEAP